MFELFTTNIGSYMWKMNRPDSDLDMATIYIMDSRDFLLGKRIIGKQTQEGIKDITFYEIGHVIPHLLGGNVNFLWAIMSPIIIKEYKSALQELRQIVSTNLSKNCFHSINGLATHNIYHFILGDHPGAREIDVNSQIYKKKLNVIGRTLKFGINLLTWNKCLFEKVEIQKEEELWELKNKLNDAYNKSTLPLAPNPKPFENYLIKWRLFKMNLEKII